VKAVVLKRYISNDSLFYVRGERYFTNNDLTSDSLINIKYIGAVGDTNLPKPVIDGSVFHFDFDSAGWIDSEIINGVKFYQIHIPQLENAGNVYAGEQMLTLAREPDADETVVTGQKNSFTGFFKIDSVDAAQPNLKFYDFSNKADWGKKAELVTKTQNWSYEVRNFQNDSDGYTMTEPLQDPFRKNYGYFIQNSCEALDKVGEWYFDNEKRILYFSPGVERCVIYISGASERNIGLKIVQKRNITVENIEFVNCKTGIAIEESENIKVLNCVIKNCVYGIFNKNPKSDKINILKNTLKNIRSFGVKLNGDSILIANNSIDSVGMTLGCESRGYNNLCGIDLRGKDNTIRDNHISNTGYSGIRFFGSSGCKVIGNTVENTVQVMADGGAIYTWHYIEGDKNKIIRKNIVRKAYGNADGTTGSYNHSSGIYLDELSLNFRVDSNYVTDCGGGIYIQNSRSDTVMFNRTEKNANYEFHINHAGAILNGGRLNPDNDPEFDPDKLDSIPKGYTWDKKEGLLYYKNKKNGIVYVKPGNNLVKDNVFIPDAGKNKFSFKFSTWQNLTDNLVTNLTGNDDFFCNNIPDSLIKNAAIFFHASDVKDMRCGGRVDKKVRNLIDKNKFKFLRQIKFWTGWGTKIDIENRIR